jgi:hypothetical protein
LASSSFKAPHAKRTLNHSPIPCVARSSAGKLKEPRPFAPHRTQVQFLVPGWRSKGRAGADNASIFGIQKDSIPILSLQKHEPQGWGNHTSETNAYRGKIWASPLCAATHIFPFYPFPLLRIFTGFAGCDCLRYLKEEARTGTIHAVPDRPTEKEAVFHRLQSPEKLASFSQQGHF